MLLHNILLEIKNREVKGRREVREDFYNFFQDLRVRVHSGGRGGRGKGNPQGDSSLSREPNAGLNARTPGPRPESEADTQTD